MGITPAGALAFLIFLLAVLVLLLAGLMLLAGISIGVGMYWVTSGQWRHAGRIWLAFIVLSLMISLGLALSGTALFTLHTGGRTILSTASSPFPQLMSSGAALLCTGVAALVFWHTRIYEAACRRQGNPPSTPLV
jgi:hypothetical protein